MGAAKEEPAGPTMQAPGFPNQGAPGPPSSAWKFAVSLKQRHPRSHATAIRSRTNCTLARRTWRQYSSLSRVHGLCVREPNGDYSST